MTEHKIIVCLANSIKHRERCVAGVEIVDGSPPVWIRPVSSRAGHGVSTSEMEMDNGETPAILDVIRIAFVESAHNPLQPENWLLDDTSTWEKVGELPYEELVRFQTEPSSLWGTGSSSGKGSNDRVSEDTAATFGNSIALVRVDQLVLRVFNGGYFEVKREVRARFQYSGYTYDLAVTDPIYKMKFLGKPDGEYTLNGCFVTISVAEPFTDGFCYKVVAAIIE